MLAAAVSMPPHARVNSRCWPVWNANKSDLQLVWDGETYNHTFHAFSVQPTSSCYADGCVQRLFCTDSGAAGWYGSGTGSYGQNAPLYASWLGHVGTNYSTTLAVKMDDVNSTVLNYANRYGPGTVAVAGSVLYYYTYVRSTSVYALPRLSSLVFAPWAAGKAGSELVRAGLVAHNVVGYGASTGWSYSSYTPIYLSGAETVTVSVGDYLGNSYGYWYWSVDAVVDVAAEATGALVHYTNYTCPSVRTASREVATFPGYTCRAAVEGDVTCAQIDSGRYTWETGAQTRYGYTFEPLLARFTLPAGLWLHRQNTTFVALVGAGHAPVLAVSGDVLYAVERAENASCGGHHLVLAQVALPAGVVRRRSASLGCAPELAVPNGYAYEPSYAALAVKWMPWADEHGLFVAQSLAASEYAAPACGDGRYASGAECRTCPAGRLCAAGGWTRCPAGTHHAGWGAADAGDCLACAPGTWADAGFAECLPESECPAGSWCADGRRTACGAGYWSAPGATDAAACRRDDRCTRGGYCAGGARLPCPAGTWGAALGLTAADQCTACPAGTWSEPGAASEDACRPVAECPAGSYCADGARHACPAGTWSATPGAAACTRCPDSKWSAAGAASQAACAPCPAGSFCTAGARAPCPAGTHGGAGLANERQCALCPDGTWSDAGAAECLPLAACPAGSWCADGLREACPPGTWSEPGATHEQRCLPDTQCPAGSYCAGGVRTPCPAGWWSDAAGLTHALGCRVCPPGTWSAAGAASERACDGCPVGFFCRLGLKTACPAGTYDDLGWQSTAGGCAACGAGQWSGAGETGCHSGPCPAGSWCADGARHECPAGTSSPEGATSADACTRACAPGTVPAGADCAECAAGHACDGSTQTACAGALYQPEPGQRACLVCGAGRYTDAAHTACAECPAGYACDGSGARAECGAHELTLGADGAPVAAGAVRCAACPAGHVCAGGAATACTGAQYAADEAGAPGAVRCADCPAGAACADGLLRACGPGAYQPAGGQRECLRCDGPAQVTDAAHTRCADCAPGETADAAHLVCSACAPGTYTGAGGACLACPAGSACQGGAAAVCEPGTFPALADSSSAPPVAEGARYCAPCPAGSACDGTTKTACGAGRYSADNACAPCPENRACSGGLLGAECAAGTYAAEGAGACSACPAGHTCTGGAPVLCAGDTYAVGGTRCEACPAGHTCAGGVARRAGAAPALLYGGIAAAAGVTLVAATAVGTALACRARRRSKDRMNEMLHL